MTAPLCFAVSAACRPLREFENERVRKSNRGPKFGAGISDIRSQSQRAFDVLWNGSWSAGGRRNHLNTQPLEHTAT